MPRVHHVKKAAKDNPAVKAGQPYYWWKFRYGGKQYSATYPKPSQLTGSPYLSEALAIQEELETPADSLEDAQAHLGDLADRATNLADMAQESFDNMPEGLQQGPAPGS